MDGARGFEESCKRMGDFRIRRYNNYLIIAKFVVRIYVVRFEIFFQIFSQMRPREDKRFVRYNVVLRIAEFILD